MSMPKQRYSKSKIVAGGNMFENKYTPLKLTKTHKRFIHKCFQKNIACLKNDAAASAWRWSYGKSFFASVDKVHFISW